MDGFWVLVVRLYCVPVPRYFGISLIRLPGPMACGAGLVRAFSEASFWLLGVALCVLGFAVALLSYQLLRVMTL